MAIVYCDELSMVYEIVDEHGISVQYDINLGCWCMVFNDKRIPVSAVNEIQDL